MIGNKQSTEAAGLGAGNWVLDVGKIRSTKFEIRIKFEVPMTNEFIGHWSFVIGH